MTINPASKTLYGVLAVLAFLLVGYFYIQESSSIREQLEQSLSERAEEASLRMSKSISLTAWEVYQQSTDRKFPEQLAAEILDSELETDFVLAIVVLGNFGHILMGREKTATGDIKSITKPSDISVDYANKVRTPMTQGTMTIGHIEIYFTDKFHIGNIKRATLASALRFLLYSFFKDFASLKPQSISNGFKALMPASNNKGIKALQLPSQWKITGNPCFSKKPNNFLWCGYNIFL